MGYIRNNHRLPPISFLSYPIYLDISTEGDVNLIAAIVTEFVYSRFDFGSFFYTISVYARMVEW